MAQRYGRNQRRAHRERIAVLERQASNDAMRAASAERRLASAREDAMREMVRSEPFVKEAMKRIGAELGRAMGPHFADHVYKLMDANQDRRHSSPISFDAAVNLDSVTVSYIEGRVEPLHYRIAIMLPDLWRAA